MKSRMTIRTQLVLANIVIFGLLLSGFGYFVYYITEKSELSQVDARLEVLANSVITEFEDEWEEERLPKWDELLALTAEGVTHSAIMIQDSVGKIVVSTGNIEQPDSASLMAALMGHISRYTKQEIDARIRIVCVPVEFDNQIDFVLTASGSLEDVDQRLANLLLILILSVMGTTFIAAIAIHVVTTFTFAPMSRMVATAEGITPYTLHHRITVDNSKDEVSRLALALNSMMDRIEIAFESQKRFVSEASHELRTPLTVIIGELEFVEKKFEEVNLKEHIGTVLGELDRLTKLVEQLLTLTRIDARRLTLHKKEIRLDELVLDCIGFLKGTAIENSITFDVQIGEPVVLQADPIHLKSAVLNLLDNALKYAYHNTVISIELEHHQDKSALLTIANLGIGISDKEKKHIFDRFYRSDRVRSNSNGSGLGLAITKELIELHHGTIALLPESGNKVIFQVKLPLA